MTGPKHPQTRLPFGSVLAITALNRQNETGGLADSALENPSQARSLFRVVEVVILRIQIYRELSFFEYVSQRIFVSRDEKVRAYRQPLRQCLGESLRIGFAISVVTIGIRNPLSIAPQR